MTVTAMLACILAAHLVTGLLMLLITSAERRDSADARQLERRVLRAGGP